MLVLRYSCNSEFRYQNTCSFSVYCTVQYYSMHQSARFDSRRALIKMKEKDKGV